ncbi:hypothetical protein RGQ15_13685 [Paracoccus sp. MBLB3053]|uniref:Uncharacterized protein n=1 Tax=Paracoccus aurantius TaxID=3073814 RepID=A0ABU2HU85_9RHOB|nr:hypothetical protein [Paracoccus sp. MBLB3053]MDS9468616.1 hypothetical protein [Paracoccus sp. MBLB3053]
MKDLDINLGEDTFRAPRVVFDSAAGSARRAAEQDRLTGILRRATPVEGCGPAIPIAPARGAQVSVTPHVMMPDEKAPSGWKVERTGWRGFKAARGMDIFDDLERRAAAKKDRDGNPGKSPFTKGQVDVARRYRDLVERHDAGGMRCASLEARRGSGPSGGGEFIDAFIAEGEAIAVLRRRIGNGVAMAVRRVRPSARGVEGARIIMDRILVDAICLAEDSFEAVLVRHGWSKTGRNVGTLIEAMRLVLDRMQGNPRAQR